MGSNPVFEQYLNGDCISIYILLLGQREIKAMIY